MASNQASMARRQRERARMQQAQEKQAKRQERREQKSKVASPRVDNPFDDPTIDWGGAVRETKLPPMPEELVQSTTEDETA
jgi:hypothetical protein